jgi:hypothetical protein
MKMAARRALVQVGDGRGFVIKANTRRFVVTAAHCLPNLPPPASISYSVERTYKNLLDAVGERRGQGEINTLI